MEFQQKAQVKSLEHTFRKCAHERPKMVCLLQLSLADFDYVLKVPSHMI